jgi:spore coat polysaccharide biosynthesis protein SpsF
MLRRVVAIIQARMGSTRLPGKILEKVGDKPLLEILVNRLKKSQYIDDIVIATTNNNNDDVVEKFAQDLNINYYRGSEEDLLGRYVESAKKFNADVVVRITGDNPLTDIDIIDTLIDAHIKNKIDYTYCLDTPLGVTAEIINSNILKEISLKADKEPEREHVTPYIRSHPEKYKILKYNSNLKHQYIRLTVDTNEDLKLIKVIYKNLGDLENLKINDVINFLKNNPEISKINSNIIQNPENTIKTINIAFLTEGSSKIGMGHVYRSITFAKEMMEILGVKAYFLTKSNENVVKTIENENFTVFKLKDDDEIVDILEELNINLTIIDNLNFKESILSQIKDKLDIKVMMVDNLTPKNDEYADVVLSLVRSNFENIKCYNKTINTRYYCGPKYLILRDEFDSFKNKKDLKPEIEDILLIFGGSDPSNHTSHVLEKLDNNIRVNIVLGPEFKHFDDLDRVNKKIQNKNVIIHKEPGNIPELMYNADLVITSPGLSMFEAAYVGSPVLAISQNDLQNHYYAPLNYEYLLPKSDLNRLEYYLDELTSLERRKDTLIFFSELDVGKGKVEVFNYLSKMVLGNDMGR